jgi:hypothetical protein
LLGSEDEVIGHLFSASMPPDDLKEVCASFLELIVGEIDHYETLKRRLREDTSITYSTMTGSLVSTLGDAMIAAQIDAAKG